MAMDAHSDIAGEADIQAQLKRLRAQVDEMLGTKLTPHVEEMARQGVEYAREHVQAVSNRVREQPIGAVLIAAAAGYLLGRVFR
jgi:ElaB/YqjD/DUF883 family membrane-anchored ribosome-binding protein